MIFLLNLPYDTDKLILTFLGRSNIVRISFLIVYINDSLIVIDRCNIIGNNFLVVYITDSLILTIPIIGIGFLIVYTTGVSTSPSP